MKKLLLLLFFFALQHLAAQEAEIKQSIQVFFEGFHARDTVKMKSVSDANMLLQTVSQTLTGTKLIREKASEFMNAVAKLPSTMRFEERLLSYAIKIDGAMAHAWIPYEFYVGGKLIHKGVNSIQLFKEKDIWKIIYIGDTRRKE